MTIQEIDRLKQMLDSPDKSNFDLAVTYLENLEFKENLIDILLVLTQLSALKMNFLSDDIKTKLQRETIEIQHRPSFNCIARVLEQGNYGQEKYDLLGHYLSKFYEEAIGNMYIISDHFLKNKQISVKVELKKEI